LHICIFVFESSLEVKSYNDAEAFLKLLDIKKILSIDKQRIIYEYKNIKIVIDNFYKYGCGVELELSENISENKAIVYLKKIAKKLGLKEKHLFDGGLGWIIMKKNAKF